MMMIESFDIRRLLPLRNLYLVVLSPSCPATIYILATINSRPPSVAVVCTVVGRCVRHAVVRVPSSFLSSLAEMTLCPAQKSWWTFDERPSVL